MHPLPSQTQHRNQERITIGASTRSPSQPAQAFTQPAVLCPFPRSINRSLARCSASASASSLRRQRRRTLTHTHTHSPFHSPHHSQRSRHPFSHPHLLTNYTPSTWPARPRHLVTHFAQSAPPHPPRFQSIRHTSTVTHTRLRHSSSCIARPAATGHLAVSVLSVSQSPPSFTTISPALHTSSPIRNHSAPTPRPDAESQPTR